MADLTKQFDDLMVEREPAINDPYRAHGFHTVYIGNLSPSTTEEKLLNLLKKEKNFEPYLIRVVRDPATGDSYRYAFVNFKTAEEAKNVIVELNYVELDGRPLRLMHKRDDRLPDTAANIFVRNIAPHVTERTLWETFSLFGNVESVKIPTVYKNGKPLQLNYGFIQFSSAEEAEKAMEVIEKLENKPFNLVLEKFVPQKHRNAKKLKNLYMVKNVPKSLENLVELLEGAAEFVSSFERHELLFFNLKIADEALKKVEEKIKILSLENNAKMVLEKTLSKAEIIQRFNDKKKKLTQKTYGRNIYVNNIPRDWTLEEFRKLCENHGKIEAISLGKRVSREKNEEYNDGYGLCCYVDKESAEKAIQELHNLTVQKKKLNACLYKDRDTRRAEVAQQYGYNAINPHHVVGLRGNSSGNEFRKVFERPRYNRRKPDYGRETNPKEEFEKRVKEAFPNANATKIREIEEIVKKVTGDDIGGYYLKQEGKWEELMENIKSMQSDSLGDSK